MKFCSKCGAELFDESIFCVKCGCPTECNPMFYQKVTESEASPSALSTAAKVFMILGTVFLSLWTFFVGLAWSLPMTLSYCNSIRQGKHVGVGFKICSLLFVSGIAGIWMLCDKERQANSDAW